MTGQVGRRGARACLSIGSLFGWSMAFVVLLLVMTAPMAIAADNEGAGALEAPERLALSAREIERLGVQLASPEPASRIPLSIVGATVTAPPASQHVLSAPIGGLLVRVLVASGDRVRVGQGVAAIESPDLVGLQVHLLDAGSRLRLAAAQLDREKALVADGIVPARRYDQTIREYEEAVASVALARQRLALVGLSPQEVERLVESRTLVPRHVIRSPIDGIVLEQYEMPGARLHPSDPIVRVADLSELWLMLDVGAEQLREVRPGQLVVPAGEMGSPIARVAVLGAEADAQTQTVHVRAVMLPSVTGAYHLGEFLSVQILQDASAQERVWSVPSAAVVRAGRREVVFRRDSNGFVVQPVTVLREDGPRTLIRAAVDEDVRVAVTGTATLKALWQQ
jgi:cobalt-zinc-cadmium efflux system membrane fusion protein